MTARLTLRAKFFWLALLNLTVLGLMLLVLVKTQLGQEFRSFLMATAREKIVAVSREVSMDLASPGHGTDNEVLAQYSQSYGVEFRLYGEKGERLAGPDSPVPPEVQQRLVRGPAGRTPPRPGPGTGPPPFLIEAGQPSQYWIGVRVQVAGPDGPNTVRGTLLLVSPTLFRNPFFFEWEPWLAIVVTAVVVTLLCWLPLVRGLTRDIGKMTSATAEIAEGQFDIEVEARRGDELGALGRSINQMASKLREYLHGQKRFLGDAAHELRSPLGRMQMALGILERKTDEDARQYVQELQEDVELLSGLTTELLTFARSEMKLEPVVPRPVQLAAVVDRALKVEGDGAPAKVNVDEGLSALGDENLLFRALSNLVRNAIRYAGDRGPLEIAARKDHDRVIVTVGDHGPGVPEEALEQVFTPFFRLDPARQRQKGGTGLGLAIVRSCIEACGGTVHAENRKDGSGLLVVVRLKAV